MATRRRVRKNIKEDQLVTFTVRLSRWSQEHFNQVIIGVVALIAVIAVVVFTANSRRSSSKQADIMMGSAMTLFRQGDYDSARQSFEQIDQRFSGDTAMAARYFLAESELRQNKFSDALAVFDRYLTDYEKYPEFRAAALKGKALCLEGLQRYDEAAQTLVTLLGILPHEDPRYLDTAYEAGVFFAKAGKQEQAAKYFDEVASKGVGDLKSKATVAAALLSK